MEIQETLKTVFSPKGKQFPKLKPLKGKQDDPQESEINHDLKTQETLKTVFSLKGKIVSKVKTPGGKTRVKDRKCSSRIRDTECELNLTEIDQ